LIQDGSYETLQALEKDVEIATTEILASSGASDPSTVPTSPEDTALQGKVLAFQTILRSLVSREEAHNIHPQAKKTKTNGDTQASKEDGSPVPIKEEEQEPEVPQSRTVLTLYGSAPPKQLFSSLQQPHRVSPANGISALDTAVKVTLPLREANLPSLITTTEVYPLPEPDSKDKDKKVATIGDVFKAPAHLSQISPPKSVRPTTSKGNSTITFTHQEAPKPRRKGSQSYAHQNLASGFWLGYGGVDMPKDQTSPTAKQKSRQRALSMGEAQQPPSEAILVAVQQAKEDALFRSAYSSFAPSRDDSSAIIPEETKNMVWWQKVGEKRFNETFPVDPALLSPEEAEQALVNGTTDEDEQFKEAVENFTPLEADILPGSEEKSEEERGTDEVLKEISEMLETLASHQRIRNLSLTTNPRTPVVQNASLATLVGSPSTPSSEEFDVYQILKSQLTLLISTLPPYAVAKLNGDQMDELNISRTILFDTKEYKGVLEEDQLSKLAKVPAVPVATPATLARTSSGTNPHYPASTHHQYSRPVPSVPQLGARPVYPQQQPLHRSSSMHLQRSPSGAAQTFQPGGASYAPASRPGYSATPSYNQQTPRPSYGTTPSGQYIPQRSAQASSYGGTTGSQYYNSTPQAQGQNRYATQQNQSSFYPRSQNVAPLYNSAQTPQPPTVSPMKAAPALSSYGTRPVYATPVSGGQMRSTYYGPQYATPQAPATAAPYNGMPTNTQQMMLERQQAQVAAQSQARLAAQNSFSSRAGSGTPQPPNGSMYGANGSSMST
jgi:hypothetical protein